MEVAEYKQMADKLAIKIKNHDIDDQQEYNELLEYISSLESHLDG